MTDKQHDGSNSPPRTPQASSGSTGLILTWSQPVEHRFRPSQTLPIQTVYIEVIPVTPTTTEFIPTLERDAWKQDQIDKQIRREIREAIDRTQPVGSNPRAAGPPAQGAGLHAQTVASTTQNKAKDRKYQDTHMADLPTTNECGDSGSGGSLVASILGFPPPVGAVVVWRQCYMLAVGFMTRAFGGYRLRNQSSY